MKRPNSSLLTARAELASIASQGALLYANAQQLAHLRDNVAAWIDEMGIVVVFAPDTPADLKDYLLGATVGAMEGAVAGATIGLLLGALFRVPTAGMALGLAGGAAVGAGVGAAAVANGYRVRVRVLDAAHGPRLLVEAR